MTLSNADAERLVRQGVAALQANRPEDARALFAQVTASGRANAQIWLLHAVACRDADDPVGQEAALDALLALDPRAVRGLVMKGDCRRNAGDIQAATSFYRTALRIADGQNLPPDLVAELQRASREVAEAESGYSRFLDQALSRQGFAAAARSPRFQQSLDILSGEKQVYLQQPTTYFFPGLPHIQFYEAADFPWAAAMEAAAGEIRAELIALLQERREAFVPYMRPEENRPGDPHFSLMNNPDWSALYLCDNGALDAEMIARCPRTWAAVQAAPLQRINHWGPAVMFSLLRAGARIPPHHGMLNTRLVCHLPLIVPEGCGFRVGNETRAWEEGKMLIFDDTIEHEAWNEGAEDRVVLIFDIWRPELSAAERAAVTAMFGALDEYRGR